MTSVFRTTEGHEEMVTMGSVAYFVDRGYQVVFDKDDDTGEDISRMTHKATGRVSRFRRQRNIWILDAFQDDSSFIGQGAR